MSELLSIGWTHHLAPLKVRERVALSAEALPTALSALNTAFAGQLQEAAILSTCNRTEIYVVGARSLETQLPHWLASFRQLPAHELMPYCAGQVQEATVRHVFRVASGLDSMVLGEAQILGQLKQSFKAANAAGSIGSILHQLFQRSFATAKTVRSDTVIGRQSVSMAAAAVRLVERVFGDLKPLKILFIGAGQMVHLCVTHFAAHRPVEICIANRSLDAAQILASRVGGQAVALRELPEILPHYDVVVSCTASSLPIIGLGMVARAIKARRHRPIVMIDLAVPRDIEAEVAQLDDIYLYTVDDLGLIVQSGTDTRRAAVWQAEAIIDTQVQAFMGWLRNRALVPRIRQLQQGVNQLIDQETQQALMALAQGVSPEAAIRSMARGLNQKLLHAPLSTLQSSDAMAQQQLLSWLPRLFPFKDEAE